MTRLASPIVEMSMLQGVNDMIDNVSYADSSGKLWAMASSAVTSYLSQYIPTLGGQIERSIESQRQSTYTDPNSALPKDWQYAIAKAANKIPGVEYDQIPYIDAWGRTQDTGSVAERLFGNFLSPAYSSKNNTTAVDSEIQRLYDAGQTNVLPQKAQTSTDVNGKKLSGDEYAQYQTAKGKTSYDILKSIIADSSYKGMSDDEKANVVSDAYSYSNAVAAKAVADKRGEGYSSKTLDKYITAKDEQGIDWWTYYQFRHPEDVDNSGTKTNADYYAAIKSLAGLSNSQKNYMRKVVKGK